MNLTLQQHLLPYMQSLGQRILQQQNRNLQRILQEQNRTLQETARLLSQSATQHFPNGTFQSPVSSCKYIEQGSPSGYYWIQRPTAGYASQVYCDMTKRCNSTGGWMRVAKFDMTNHTNHCPQGFRRITSPKRLCRRKSGVGCLSTTFPAHETQYQKVCGRINGYQYHFTDAFGPYNLNHSITIDGTYIDGISITHGHNPRKHIWSFAAALDEVHGGGDVCPCTKTDTEYTGRIPPFVGQDYFCDTGSRYHIHGRTYTHDPLWDGHGCGSRSTCCSFNSPPWFCKQLPQLTTDDIELRLCNDQGTEDEDVLIEIIELYVQ